jgi:demethylmacrocin O-methyltransferase
VIDDGSHIPDHVMQSWIVLWMELTTPGWYVIEDLMTSYWPEFGGSSLKTGDTVIGFLQGLIDRIHYVEFDVPGYNPNRFDLTVVGLEIARNIVFIRKGDNSEPSIVMPPHPHGEVTREWAG